MLLVLSGSKLWLWRTALAGSALFLFLHAVQRQDGNTTLGNSNSSSSSSSSSGKIKKTASDSLHAVSERIQHQLQWDRFAWRESHRTNTNSNTNSNNQQKDVSNNVAGFVKEEDQDQDQIEPLVNGNARVVEDSTPKEDIGSLSAVNELDLIQDKYSIIISTFNRMEHLHHFLGRNANGKLPRLDAIFIAWGLGGVDPPEWLELQSYKVPVHLMRAKVNSLTERFRRPVEMRTDAGLWIDDDLQIHPEDVEFGFTTFQQLGRMNHRITGYSGRQVLINDLKKEGEVGRYTYEIAQPNYSMVLTNSAFMDTQMLKWFWNMADKRMVDSIKYVDKHMNCEDILMNFVVSDKTKLPPLLVEAYDVQQLKTSGISDQPGHYLERSECITAFHDIWGGIPLKTTDVKIVPSSKEEHRRSVELDPPFRKKFNPWAHGKKFKPPMSPEEAEEKAREIAKKAHNKPFAQNAELDQQYDHDDLSDHIAGDEFVVPRDHSGKSPLRKPIR